MARLITVKELAELLGINPQTVYRKVRAKDIPYKRFGRTIRFNYEDIKYWLTKNGQKQKSEILGQII